MITEVPRALAQKEKQQAEKTFWKCPRDFCKQDLSERCDKCLKDLQFYAERFDVDTLIILSN